MAKVRRCRNGCRHFIMSRSLRLAAGIQRPASMTDISSERHPIEVLAEDFVERFRRGEQPSITEYSIQYPALAEQIRTVFPAVISLEEVKRSQLHHAAAELVGL